MKQGYSFGKGKSKLNHLLFMANWKLYVGNQPNIDSLIQTVYTAPDDIGIRFGIDKWGVLEMHGGKETKCQGITIGSVE